MDASPQRPGRPGCIDHPAAAISAGESTAGALMPVTRKRLVIFDVDGTLVDSQNAIVAALTQAFAAEALSPPPRAQMLAIVGLSLDEAFASLVPAARAAQRTRMVRRYKQAFLDLRRAGRGEAAARMYPGARDLVLALHQQGHVLGVATGKARRGVRHFVDSHGLDGRFSVIQTADDAPSKPDPQMVLNCLAGAAVAPEDTVIVGDTEFDMAMGAAAGIRRIGVSWGYHPTERILRGGAEAIAEDMHHLARLLDEIW